jgi:hypothetical protein
MNPQEMNRQVENLVSIVWRAEDSRMTIPRFFLAAMESIDGLEDDVSPILKEACARGRLEITRSWYIAIPKN